MKGQRGCFFACSMFSKCCKDTMMGCWGQAKHSELVKVLLKKRASPDSCDLKARKGVNHPFVTWPDGMVLADETPSAISKQRQRDLLLHLILIHIQLRVGPWVGVRWGGMCRVVTRDTSYTCFNVQRWRISR